MFNSAMLLKAEVHIAVQCTPSEDVVHLRDSKEDLTVPVDVRMDG